MRRFVEVLAILGVVALVGCKVDESDTFPPEKAFVKFYGSLGVEKAADFEVRDDGGFVLFGTTNRGIIDGVEESSQNFYVVFADALGNQEGNSLVIDRYVRGLQNPNATEPDTTTIKLPTTEVASRIKRTSDGGYILIGTSTYNDPVGNFPQSDIFIAKISSDRAVEFTTTIGEVYDSPDNNDRPSNETGADIIEYSGGYLIVGSTNDLRRTQSLGNGSDIYFIRANQDFTSIAGVTQPFDGDDAGVGIEMNGNRAVVVGAYGRISNTLGGGINLLYYEIDPDDFSAASEGVVVGGDGDDVPERIRKISNGDYYVVGNTISGANRSAFVARFISGTPIDHYQVQVAEGVQIVASDMVRIPGNNYMMVGERLPTTDLLGSQMLLSQITPVGEVDPAFAAENEGVGKLFGGSGNDRAVAVERLSDGSFVFLGEVDLDANGNTYMCLVKTNARGELQD